MALLFASLLPVLLAQPASAAASPAHVQFTLEGCKGSVASFPETATEESDFVCADHEYTTGNLGKGWHELDLVPHRVTTSLGTQSAATTEFEFNITADHKETGIPGYDYISAPVVNAELSHDSCLVSSTELATEVPGIGGTDESMYRTVTITQDKGTTCVIDYVERLAVGSSQYPGSSLHSNLTQSDFTTGGIGNRDVSIPVRAIQPQSIDKDMTATQGAAHIWNVTKSASPANLNFADTCSSATGALEQQVEITVSWEKLAADPGGLITVVTNIHATNPAHRAITVNVTDEIFSDADLLDTETFAPVSVPANTANFLIGTHEIEVPDGTTDLHDVATASYTDTVTDVAVPGTTQATASATVQQSSDPADNSTATITDVEDITGTGLKYSVDSFTPDIGDFDGTYSAGEKTNGAVSWTSDSQSDDGSVTFTKTVYVDEPQVTSGTLSDTATLNGSDGFEATASATVSISSDATTTLTIDKTIPDILQGDETVSFTFIVYEDGSTEVVDSKDITFTAGETSKSISFSLDPGTYDLDEIMPDGWSSNVDVIGQDIDLTLPTCDQTVSIANEFGPSNAEAVKITNPAGEENGWEMCLQGPGTEGLSGGEECVITATVDSVDGVAVFTTELLEGSYTITEVLKADWVQTDAQDCSFTVDYPADFDRTFTCTFTNALLADAEAVKITDPAGAENGWDMCLAGPATASLADGKECVTTATVDSVDGVAVFTTKLTAGDYTITEVLKPGWDQTAADGCSFTVAYPADGGKTFTCTITNVERGTVTVIKTSSGQVPPDGAFSFQIREGASATEPGTVLATDTNDAAGTVDFDSLTDGLQPGQYQLCEADMLPGWETSLSDDPGFFVPDSDEAEFDNSVGCVPFTLDPGEDEVFNVENTPPPGGDARTIGFWRNWSSCTNGNQDPVLDQTLADVGGILIGDLLVDTCEEAVAILAKSSLDGTKRASDPAYNMAAQLLAAFLNIEADAGSCADADAAMAEAQALLADADFDGITVYGGSSTKGNGKGKKGGETATGTIDGERANQLAGILDAYNNNELC